MNLPRIDDNGTPYVSYSQLKLWHEAKGFDTGKPGKEEFIRKYFLNEQFEDKGGFADFGNHVEAYITERGEAHRFTEAERAVLETIQPLGIFQKEIKLDFGDFYVKGFIDDTAPDQSKIRDYKSASNKSREKYYKDDYYQLDIYALAIQQECGKIPELEVCIIERLGNGFRGGRDVMFVGSNVWYHTRETSQERLDMLAKWIVTTTKEISEYWEVFQKLNA